MSPTTKALVEAYHHTCLRCGHDWWTFTPAPKSCAKCKSKQWDKERARKAYATKGAMRQRRWRKRKAGRDVPP